MINKIKTKLIHLLGGYTEDEQRENGRNSFNDGVYTTYCYMMSFANSLYGLSADDWCKKMYQYIEKGVQHEDDITY